LATMHFQVPSPAGGAYFFSAIRRNILSFAATNTSCYQNNLTRKLF
jgi:hypothetical protein